MYFSIENLINTIRLNQKSGLLIVISGPSGVGKGTIIKKLMEKPDLNLELSISLTTRHPRDTEIHGKDYFFVSEHEFKKAIEDNELLEFTNYNDNFYGTPVKFVKEQTKKGRNVILEIDIYGGLQVQEKKITNSVFIFILPPTFEDLKKRLEKRGTDSPETIQKRLYKTNEEIKFIDKYDYIVINDSLDKALNQIESIIIASHCKLKL